MKTGESGLGSHGKTPTPTRLRLFIAILLPEHIKSGIEEAQTKLHQVLTHATVRWTQREQFHLTLRFLGQVDPLCATDLIAALALVGQTFNPLPLRAARIGFF